VGRVADDCGNRLEYIAEALCAGWGDDRRACGAALHRVDEQLNMPESPTPEQIDAAIHRAAEAARAHTRYPDRIAEFPRGLDDCEPAEDGRWHIGWVGAVGEPEEWDVLYDPRTKRGRLRKKHRGGELP
jgi:hypothetical protein